MAQRISDLNDAERAWVADNVAAARRYVDDAGPPVGRQLLDPAALDAAWAFWLQGWPADAEDPNPVINALGMAFGQYLVDHLDLAWMIVEDDFGTEIAVHGHVGDVLVFPQNLVAKRLETRTVGFFAPIAAGIERQVAQVREVHGQRVRG
jgi:hypothetical protein